MAASIDYDESKAISDCRSCRRRAQYPLFAFAGDDARRAGMGNGAAPPVNASQIVPAHHLV